MLILSADESLVRVERSPAAAAAVRVLSQESLLQRRHSMGQQRRTLSKGEGRSLLEKCAAEVRRGKKIAASAAVLHSAGAGDDDAGTARAFPLLPQSNVFPPLLPLSRGAMRAIRFLPLSASFCLFPLPLGSTLFSFGE